MTIDADLGPLDRHFDTTMALLDALEPFGPFLTADERAEIDNLRQRYIAGHDALLAEIARANRSDVPGVINEQVGIRYNETDDAISAFVRPIYGRMRRASETG